MIRLIRIVGVSIIDFTLIIFSVILSFILKFDFDVISLISNHSKKILYILLLSLIVKLLCFWAFKLYSNLWKYASIHEAVNITLAIVVANIIVMFLSLTLSLGIPFSILIMINFLDCIFLVGIRFVYRIGWTFVKHKLSSKGVGKKLMIIGAGEAGSVIVKELENSNSDLTPVAIIDDDGYKVGKKLHGVPILGNRNDIVRIAQENLIDEIIIAIPSAPSQEINKIFIECTKTRCRVRILPSISHIIDGKVSISKLRDVQIEDLLGREPIKLELENIASYVKNKVILVTGGGGSIGSELCRQIAGYLPKQLVILDNYENNAYDIKNELNFKYPDLKLKVVIANIREKQRLDSIFKEYRPEVVFHAAAHKHVPLMEDNPSEAIKNNVFGTLNTVECADKYKVSKFILISTDKAVNPTNVMGATKRIAELVIQATDRYSKTDYVAVRFGNVLGSNGSVIPLFKKQIERGGPVTVTHPDITRFFMTIPEAVQLVMQAGAMAKGGEIFVLDMGQPVKIDDLARSLIKLSGYKPDEDIKIIYSGLRPGEKLYEELLLEEEGLKATRHDKIFVAKPVLTDSKQFKEKLEVLYGLLAKDDGDVMDYIPHIVPAYTRTP